jgi:hypothetical protein
VVRQSRFFDHVGPRAALTDSQISTARDVINQSDAAQILSGPDVEPRERGLQRFPHLLGLLPARQALVEIASDNHWTSATQVSQDGAESLTELEVFAPSALIAATRAHVC